MNNYPIKPNGYIKTYKHLIGCEVVNMFGTSFIITQEWLNETDYIWEGLTDCIFNTFQYYLDEDTLGTYREYMGLHYKEYTELKVFVSLVKRCFVQLFNKEWI